MRDRRPLRTTATLLAAAVLSACAPDPGPAPEGLAVVTTTNVLGDVTADVVGEAGSVEVIMSAGQDPHLFSPSAQHARLLRQSDLVVANGLDLEEPLLDALAAAEEAGVEVLRVGEALDPREYDGGGEDDEHADEDDEHADDDSEHTLDPHVWLDPVRMADGARLIAEAVSRIAPDEGVQVDWAARGDEVAAAILAVHEDMSTILAAVPEQCRVLVTNHDALGYFADRYGFEVVGTVIPGVSTAAEPSARDVSRLAQTLRESPVPAIFAETTESTRLAETLAAEVGRDIEIVTLFTGSLGEPGSGADTYAGMMRTTATRIADALSDC